MGRAFMASGPPHVLEVEGLAVDAPRGRRDPVRELAGLDDGLHEARHVGAILFRGEPFVMPGVPFRLADRAPVRRHLNLGEVADGAMEGAMGQLQLEVDAVAPDHLVPARHPALAVGDVVVAQPLVE